jgi:phage/plasmid-associated DNA primase
MALLNFALPGDDVSLFIRWFGSALLTGNAAQGILLLVGRAATGKSTIAEVVEMVMGWTNCTALRTKLLHERFEIGRLFGYSLLTAKDVPGKFLEEEGAQALTKLVGHDYTPGERKGSMESVPVYGDFDCLITCNERLLVSLEGATDVEAWRRRLMMLEFLNELAEEQRIDNYAQVLFAEEAEGILAAAITGAITHLAELEESGNFKLPPNRNHASIFSWLKARASNTSSPSASSASVAARDSPLRNSSRHTSTIATTTTGVPSASRTSNAPSRTL